MGDIYVYQIIGDAKAGPGIVLIEYSVCANWHVVKCSSSISMVT